MSYYIGLDIGTSSTKANAFDREGNMIGESLFTYPLNETTPGEATQDPETVCRAAETALRTVIMQMKRQPLGIGISTAMHTLLPADRAGVPLMPSITYADTRGQRAIATIDPDLRRELYRHTGTPVHAMTPLVKMRWLQQEHPSLYERTACFAGIKEYLLYRWTGRWMTDHSIASATGLLETATADWYGPALELLKIGPERLPRLCHPLSAVEGIRPRVREQLGLKADIPVIIGGSDGCLANLGAGILQPGPAVLTIGTSGAIRMTQRKAATDPGRRLFNYILHDNYYVTGGASNNGGKALEWVTRQFFPGHSIPEVLDLAEQVRAATDGLIFLPYLYGERAPVWDAEASGRLLGVRSRHNRQSFARAVVEGIIFNLCLSMKGMEEAVGPVEALYANGGFTRSDWWVQLLADASGKTVHVAQTPQASAYGAALMARRGTGDLQHWDSLGAALNREKTYEPDPARHRAYAAGMDWFRQEAERLSKG